MMQAKICTSSYHQATNTAAIASIQISSQVKGQISIPPKRLISFPLAKLSSYVLGKH